MGAGPGVAAVGANVGAAGAAAGAAGAAGVASIAANSAIGIMAEIASTLLTAAKVCLQLAGQSHDLQTAGIR